jgi:hypothetical protein
LGVQDQIERLQKGHDLLRSVGLDTQVFVPPWNNYDDNTLEALAQQEFGCISADRYRPCRQRFLRYIPITTDMSELRLAVRSAKNSHDSDPIIGVLLHPYDFEESGDPRGAMTCKSFDSELRWLTAQPGVRILSVGHLCRENETLDADRFRANQPLPLEGVSPPFLRTTSATPFFATRASASRSKATRAIMTIVTHLCAALAGLALERLIRIELQARAASLLDLVRYVPVIFLFGLLGLAAVRRQVHFRTMLAIALLSGMLMSELAGYDSHGHSERRTASSTIGVASIHRLGKE